MRPSCSRTMDGCRNFILHNGWLRHLCADWARQFCCIVIMVSYDVVVLKASYDVVVLMVLYIVQLLLLLS